MVESETQELETLDCLSSDVNSPKKKNPDKDFANCDQNPSGSLEIEGAHVLKTLGKSSKDEIEGAHVLNILGKSSKDEICDTHKPKTLEKSSLDAILVEDDIEDRFNLDELLFSSTKDDDDDELNFDDENFGENLSRHNNAIVGPISKSSCTLCGHCENDDGFCDGYSGRPMTQLPFFPKHEYLSHRNSMNHYEGRWSRDRYSMRSKSYKPFPFLLWNDPEPCHVVAGLANLGNTCFLNSIIQCFIHTVPFVKGLQTLKHEPPSHGDDYCVLCAVCDQIEHSLVSNERVIFPYNLVDNLNHISSFFRRYQQEDAHEFLQCLLDKLDSNWSKYEANANDPSSSDYSLVKQVFGGRLVSQLHCSACDHNSYTYEPLIDLSLGIEEVDDLESALRCFTKVESIGDTEKFTCVNCKEQVTGEKQLMLDQAPLVAALHLKRFKSDGVYVEKIDKMVEYPLELDLRPYTNGAMGRDEELKYELYALVVHVGLSSTSGHYFCYIRTAPNSWYRFDDSKVVRVREIHALGQDAYILFYARKGTPWFSTFIEKLRSRPKKKILNTSPKSVLDDTDRPSCSKSLEVSLRHSEALEKSCTREGDDVIEQTLIISGLKHDKVQNTVGTYTQESPAENIASLSSLSGTCHEVEIGEAECDAQLSVTTVIDGSSVKPLTEIRNVDDAIRENGENEIGRLSSECCSSSCLENIIDEKAEDGVATTPPQRAVENPDLSANEEPVQVSYPIPLDHQKIEDKPPSAMKPVDKAKLDPKRKRKEVAKYIPKSSIAISRASMTGCSHIYNSLNKKRRKQISFWQRRRHRKLVKINLKRM